MAADFYMVKIDVDIPHLLGAFTQRRVRVHDDADMGYLLHSSLRETFGAESPQPFVVMEEEGQWIHMLAYSSCDADALRTKAIDYCGQHVRGTVNLDTLVTKQMPDGFQEGQVLEFKIRLCPVVRKGRGSRMRQPGSEVDVFLDALEKAGPGCQIDRRDVYTSWAKSFLEQPGGIQCTRVQLTRMIRTRFLRRDEARHLRTVERPDITVTGILSVIDAADFREMVRRGIGRHRAFGFGMLLLRRSW